MVILLTFLAFLDYFLLFLNCPRIILQDKIHFANPEFASLIAKIHFYWVWIRKNARKSVFFGDITLIFIILKLTFEKKKKKMLGLRKNYVIINLT